MSSLYCVVTFVMFVAMLPIMSPVSLLCTLDTNEMKRYSAATLSPFKIKVSTAKILAFASFKF